MGVGNILMGDEGVGVRAVEALGNQKLPPGTATFDGGTAFPALVGELAEFDKLIVIDAVRGGAPPGTLYRFGLEEVGRKGETVLSLHDVGVVESLAMYRLIRRIPEEIIFIGIEPESVALSLELSAAVKAKLGDLIALAVRELHKEEKGYDCLRAETNG